MRYSKLSSFLVAAALLGACGDDTDPMMTPDGGMITTDASTDDGGGDRDDAGRDAGPGTTGTCASPRAITLTVGTQTVTGDTTGGSTSLDMGECAGEEAAPQYVIAVTLPGSASETYGVRFDLAQDGTTEGFDTMVQLRETCASGGGALCFDDISRTEYRSAGAFDAPGGSTRFLVITGYAPAWDDGIVSEGPFEAAIEVTGPLTAPVLTGGTALNIDAAEFRVELTGTDADGDTDAFAVTFLTAAGAAIPIDTDGNPSTAPVEDFVFGLMGSEGETSFTATSRIEIDGVDELAAATQVRVALVDAFNLRSATMTLPLVAGTFADLGATCDATHVCPDAFECSTGGTCEIPAAVVTACEGATTGFLVPGSMETNTTTVTLQPGDGVLTGSCAATSGHEALLQVTGAPGFDIVLDTTGTATGMSDTVLYAVTSCGDPSSEVACNDDRAGDPQPRDSRIEIRDSLARPYTVAVEVYGGVAAPTMITVNGRLRPVLATGAACDPAGVENRCAGTVACPTTGAPVCP